MQHIPVLLEEAVTGLCIENGDVVLDATLGYGGHSAEISRRYGKEVTQYGNDLDDDAIIVAKKIIKESGGSVTIIKGNFRHIADVLKKNGVMQVNRVLFDLGINSAQLDSSGRGFTFMRDEPLVMTLESKPNDETITAYDVVNSWSEETLADIIYAYGEERFARRIARVIVENRKKHKIETTFQLVECVKEAIPKKLQIGRINPATKTFQAIRIAVNDELGSLRDALLKITAMLAPRGRIAVISFHSLEDRIVKLFIKEQEKNGIFKIVTKKPIVPTREEVLKNPRSRSAKLRIAEKIQ